MATHPFLTAMQSGARRDQLATLFAADATFAAPILSSTVQDKDLILDMLEHGTKIYGNGGSR